MDDKMMKAWQNMQSAYAAMCEVMSPPSEKQMAGKQPMKENQEMPDQEMGAEEGSYEGKGMMSDKIGEKKKMLAAAMKAKGY